LKLLRNIPVPAWLKNKYFLTTLVFTIWLLFFDDRDIITTHFKYRNELKQLEQSRNYFLQQIDTTKEELEGLKQSPVKLEKYAREKYLMKKDNEDLFISPE
jgi:cell division protein DivIC